MYIRNVSIALVAITVIGALAWAAFNMILPEVTFVVPSGYLGRLELVEMGTSNVRPAPGEIVFPASGRIEVQSLKFFETAHRLKCRQLDGTAVPLGSESKDENPALRLGILKVTDSGATLIYVIGTKADEESVVRSTARFER